MYLKAALALVIGTGSTAQAAQTAAPPERVAQFRALMDCRAISQESERLRCFDREAAAMDAAEARKDVIVLDKQQIRSTRRSLFGLTLPRLPFLGDGEEAEATQQIEGVVRAVRSTRDDKLMVQVDDALWQTTEAVGVRAPPRVGDKVTIRRGLLGSFVLAASGRSGFRAIRVR